MAAEEPEGPWRFVGLATPEPSTRKGMKGMWEDPYLFQDAQENWHVIAHTYTRVSPQAWFGLHMTSSEILH